MNFRTPAWIAATLFGLALAVPPQAQAMVANSGVTAPSAIDAVACRTVRERVVRPGGRVIYKTSRRCGPWHRHHWRRHCRVERQRVIRPSGAVVYKRIRRCD
jgi:hypothetical protein